jgi:hypothetical protein
LARFNQVNQGKIMQVNQGTKQKIQLVELALSDYLFEMKADYDPLIDAHVAIVSVMRDLEIPFLELEFNQVNQGRKAVLSK